MTARDQDAATGALPAAPALPLSCVCKHPSPLHALTPTRGRRGPCSASTCKCRAFDPQPAARAAA